MFNFISSRKNAGKVLSSFVVLACAAFVLCVASCKEPDGASAENTVYGTWKSSYSEYFVISSDSKTITNYYGSISDSTECYAGSDVFISATDDTSGYIYLKYTRAGYDTNSDGYVDTYTTDGTLATDVGKWYAVAYKNLTSASCSFCGAYLATGVTSTDSLDEAKSTFTIDNGYFSYYSECTKQ